MRRALASRGEDITPPTENPSDATPATAALYVIAARSLTTPEERRYAVGSAIVAGYWARPFRFS
jgi:hypothetical protein